MISRSTRRTGSSRSGSDLIAATEGEAFYRGGLAERIVAAAKAEGGAMILDDLAQHKADWVEPLGIRSDRSDRGRSLLSRRAGGTDRRGGQGRGRRDDPG